MFLFFFLSDGLGQVSSLFYNYLIHGDSSGIRYDLLYGSVNTLIYKASSELLNCVLVHFWEHEFVIVKLFANLLPKMRLASSKSFPDICAICSSIADEVGVEFARDCPSESPVYEDRVEDCHTDKVVSDCTILASVHES